MKTYVCEQCGNVITKIVDSGVPVMCCGKPMTALIANTVEASVEKHLPVVDIKNGKVNVTVGAVAHPMVPEHFIEWLYLETEKGGQLRKLVAGEAPEAIFSLNGEKAIAVYAYCNLHGLWKTEIVEEAICDLQPVDHDTTENYIVCNCNQVSYFTILDEVQKHGNIEQLLDVFEQVKDTTHCSTGCGGCYDKVIEIISEAMSGGKK